MSRVARRRSGMKRIVRRSRGMSKRIAVGGSPWAAIVKPPRSAAAALSGWPSSSVARASARSTPQRLPRQRRARQQPADRGRRRRPEAAGQRDPVAHLDPPAQLARPRRRGPPPGRARGRPRRRSSGPRAARRRPRPPPRSRRRRRAGPGTPPRRGRRSRGRRRGSRSRRRGWRSWPGPRRRSSARPGRRSGSSTSVSLHRRRTAAARPRPTHRHPSASMTAGSVASASSGGSTRRAPLSGSFRPCPVSTQTTVRVGVEPPLGAQLPDAGQARRRGRLAEDAGQPDDVPVGGEDLVVGHRLDQAAALVAGGGRLLPRRRVADPDRGRERLRVLDRVARPRSARRRRPGSPTSRGRRSITPASR